MESMGSLSAVAALRLPVNVRGRRLGRPIDILLETARWQALGFVVRCTDESERFLPFAASQLRADEIAVASELMLLEDVGFYAQRGVSFRSLLAGEVARDNRPLGPLRDLRLGAGGRVLELELGGPGPGRQRRRIPASAATVVPTRASAA